MRVQKQKLQGSVWIPICGYPDILLAPDRLQTEVYFGHRYGLCCLHAG